ncbi:MAG: DUF5116 domain-containing protein [Paludibacteraceae bacterium]|nr:DUF5116 domain-containing protein [Paludibacteraceae bacterium]
MKKTFLLISAVCAWCLCANASDKPAPLYWSAYEYCYNDVNGSATANGYIPEEIWQKNIDWMAENLKSYGYNMICIDGWGDADGGCFTNQGYKNKHDKRWKYDYAYWSNYCRSKGMTLGIYINPLWVEKYFRGDAIVEGTQTTKLRDIVSDYQCGGGGNINFDWVDVNKKDAEKFVKNYINYYGSIGVTYLRCDFLSWFEDGKDRNPDFSTPCRRSVEDYQTALSWMKEACDENGITLSLVMPHLYNHAITERTYAPGSLIRIDDDVVFGSWKRFSEEGKGVKHDVWPTYHNAFDGFIYWSDIAGKNKNNMILDGDFTRLNTFANDNEKKTVISLQIMAGGPIAVSDQYSTIKDNLKFYQNEELLALHHENFVGHPLSNNVTDDKSLIWTGKAGECDYILALFNRDNGDKTYNIDFKEVFGIENPVEVRDLWEHKDLGKKTSVSVSVPPHGCFVYRLKAN